MSSTIAVLVLDSDMHGSLKSNEVLTNDSRSKKSNELVLMIKAN